MMIDIMFSLPRYCILYDTEYTAWEGSQERRWSGEGEHKELVQIGAIRIDTETLEELDALSILVKPTINPTLSDYFIELTGIDQEHVDADGVSFEEAVTTFGVWIGEEHCYAFGRDIEIFEENCRLHDVPDPLKKEQFHNIRELFRTHGIDVDRYSSGTIVEAFGETPVRRGHDGLNDARTVLDGLRALRRQVRTSTGKTDVV